MPKEPDAPRPGQGAEEEDAVRSGRPSRAFAWAVTVFCVPILVALVVAAAASWRYLPSISSLPASNVRSLLPGDTRAERAEAAAAVCSARHCCPERWLCNGLPVGSRPATSVPSSGPRCFSTRNGSRDSRAARAPFPTSTAASCCPARASRRRPRSRTSRFRRRSLRRTSGSWPTATPGAVSLPGAARATGFIPGSVAQSNAIDTTSSGSSSRVCSRPHDPRALPALALAPLVTLAAAGIAYLISIGVVAYLARRRTCASTARSSRSSSCCCSASSPTTRSSSCRRCGNASPRARRLATAARRSTAQVVPIVFTAGLVVAAGLATLRLASIGFVQALGPAMAVVVLVSLGVSITFVPAAMRILGRALFWPGLPGARRSRAAARASVPRSAARPRPGHEPPTVRRAGGACSSSPGSSSRPGASPRPGSR